VYAAHSDKIEDQRLKLRQDLLRMDMPDVGVDRGDSAYRRQLSEYLQANGLKLVEFEDFDTLHHHIDDTNGPSSSQISGAIRRMV